ncbi:MAG TPA: NYN domain-containing protein [Chloroflexota bacterium]|nr:NYN domain-containing protein [Chloroflexota bacterium]
MKTEEKGSDVNIATYLLVDAYEGEYDAAVIVSDDSDLAEPIRVVHHKLHRHVTVLSPRGRAYELKQAATRFRQIDPGVLAQSQFPLTLRDARGTLHKPLGW